MDDDARGGRAGAADGWTDDFGLDTTTLAGSLEAKLAAIRDAGFTQVMLGAGDLVGHPGGEAAAIRAVRASGLRVTGLQVLRDFEGLAGHLHDYKVDVAQALLGLARAVGAPLLLACSSTSRHADVGVEAIARDLRKLAMLALPLGLKVAYEALSWGRAIREVPAAWEAIVRADMPNLGLGLDAFHLLATKTPLAALDDVDVARIHLVQLADFMWRDVPSIEERIDTARHFRVFPGEGVHGAEIAALVRRLDATGYAGDYSFEVFNDDYRQMPAGVVAARGRASARWLGLDVLRRAVPQPDAARLQRGTVRPRP